MKRKILFFLSILMFVLYCGSFGKESPAEIKAYIEKIRSEERRVGKEC